MARVNFFMVDERIVPLSSPDSNFGGLHTSLFKHLIDEGVLSATQLHPFEASAENVSVRCAEYMRELSNFGSTFSVVVLGVGEDGHVAGLFPEHPVLKKSGQGFEYFFDSPKPPAARMTASRDLVTSASLGVVLALGEGKRSAWEAFQDKSVLESRCPVKMTLGMKRCVVVTDLE
jgi:6-phosphogluconolactonase